MLNESDFPQFDDPRVREVMSAAANLVEYLVESRRPWGLQQSAEERALTTALFAAQHSRPKLDGPESQLANFCKGCGHIAWLVHLKEGRCLDCQEAAQHSKPKETPEHFEARVLDAIAGYPSLEKPKPSTPGCSTLELARRSRPKSECANHGASKPAVGNGDLCQECLDDVGEP